MRRVLFAAVVIAWSETARADAEVSLAYGLTHASSSSFDGAGASAVRNGGLGVALHGAMRFTHPVMPFIELGDSAVYASDDAVDLGAYGGRTVARSHSRTWWALAGPEVPIGPVRLWGGIGAFGLQIRSTVLGQSMSTGDLSMGYGLGASVHLLSRRWFRVGVAGRVLLMSEVETALYHGGLFVGAVL